MARYMFQNGCVTVTVKHLVRRSSGAYYYRRGIPADLRKFYNDKREHNHSLQTHVESEAIKKCQALTLRHHEEFKQLRLTGDRAKAVALLDSYGLAPTPIADQSTPESIHNDGNPYNQLI